MDLHRWEGLLWSLGQGGGLLAISFLTEKAGVTVSLTSPRQSCFMLVFPGKLLIASPLGVSGLPFWTIHYMSPEGGAFQSELFQGNGVKYY